MKLILADVIIIFRENQLLINSYFFHSLPDKLFDIQFTDLVLLSSLLNDQNRCSSKFCKIHRKTLATLLKKRLWHRCFPVNFTKFLRTPFLQSTSE